MIKRVLSFCLPIMLIFLSNATFANNGYGGQYPGYGNPYGYPQSSSNYYANPYGGYPPPYPQNQYGYPPNSYPNYPSLYDMPPINYGLSSNIKSSNQNEVPSMTFSEPVASSTTMPSTAISASNAQSNSTTSAVSSKNTIPATNTDNVKKIMMMSAGHGNPAKNILLDKLAAEQDLSIKHVKLRRLDPDAKLVDVTKGFDVLLLDDVSAGQTQKNFATLMPQVKSLSSSIKIVALRWPQGKELRKDVTEAQGLMLEKYFSNGGRENFSRMLTYIRVQLLGDTQVAEVLKPIEYPKQGIYHPQRAQDIFAKPRAYLDWYRSEFKVAGNAPVIGILVHQENLVSENTALTDDIIERIAKQGAIPMAVYFRSGRKASKFVDWLLPEGKAVMDALINTRVIHWAEENQKLFSKLGVTVLQAISHSRNEQNWREDNGGIPAMMIPFI